VAATSQKIPYVDFQLRSDLDRYLRHSRSILNKTEWYFGGRQLEVDSLHIDQNVITEQIKERIRLPGNERLESEPEFKQSPLEITQQAKLYELSNNFPERVQTTWSNAVGKNDLRLAIIGAPGSGKSFTTKYTVIQKIDYALDLSQRRDCKLEDIQIPIWVTATELASQNIDQPAAALEAIVRSSLAKFRLTEKFFKLLRHKLDLVFDQPSDNSHYSARNEIYLVVDSLDELPENLKDSFHNISTNLDKPSLQLVVTCRTLQWNERSSWLGFMPKEKVEIALLTKSQQRKFSSQFFRERQDLRSTMRGLLDGNPALSHAFTTPLLLMFGCLLHGEVEHAIDESTTYVQIYGSVISKIFSGSWREDSKKPYWANSRIETGRHLELLDKICWELFQKDPEANLFTLADWKQACQKARTIGEDEDIKTYDFLAALEKLGFIVEAGYKQALPQWSFAHRTFLEFLAARALAKRDDWLEIAREHFWLAPEWLECLTFLAGFLEVKKVKTLIQAVRTEKDDIFGSMVFLEAELTALSHLSGKDIEPICDAIIYGLVQKHVWEDVLLMKRPERTSDSNLYEGFLKPALSSLNLNSFCHEYIFETLFRPIINLLQNQNDNIGRARLGAASALAFLGNDSPKVVKALIKSVRTDKDPRVRWLATAALRESGDNSLEVTDVLTNSLKTDQDEFLRRTTAGSLRALGNDSRDVIDALVQCLQNDEDTLVRMEAADGLGTLGNDSPGVIDALISSLENDEYVAVRERAATVLGAMKSDSPKAIKALINSLQIDPNYWVRGKAAVALYELDNDSPEVIDALTKYWQPDENYSTRQVSVKMLNRLFRSSSEDRGAFIKALIKSLQDSADREIRKDAALALGCYGDNSPEIIDALISSLQNDEDDSPVEFWPRFGGNVRESAATALGKLGDNSPKVMDAIINSMLTAESESTRFYTANALGNICVRNKSSLSYSDVLKIMKLIASQLNQDGYILDSKFSKPLFEMWQACRTNENNPTLTWKILRTAPPRPNLVAKIFHIWPNLIRHF
jgi:HEAT repeat protein